MTSPIRRVLGGLSITFALGALGVVVAPVSAAQADLLGLGGNSCTPSATSQPFAPWGDSASYELVPGGDFETASWSLQGGAEIVPGSEPYAAYGDARLVVVVASGRLVGRVSGDLRRCELPDDALLHRRQRRGRRQCRR